jgi:tetratricopeptide (TPR) repeat protein
MAKTRYIEAYETSIPEKLKKTYIEEGIQYATEALSINPDAVELLYILGVMYYKNPEPDDVAAKKTFEKIIELDPTHIDAYIALSELYLKHKNKDKQVTIHKKQLR